MHYHGPSDPENPRRRTPALEPLTEWRTPRGPQSAPTAEPLQRRSRFWLGMAAGLLVLIVTTVVLFNEPGVEDIIAATPVADTAPAKAAPQRRAEPLPLSRPPVTLPSGVQIDRSSTLNYDLAAWLATAPTAPRGFMFDRLRFAPGSAVVSDDDKPALQVLSQILTAYPQTRVVIVANGPGSLAQERSVAIRDALLALAADPDQLDTRAGDGSESAPRIDVKFEMGVGADLDA